MVCIKIKNNCRSRWGGLNKAENFQKGDPVSRKMDSIFFEFFSNFQRVRQASMLIEKGKHETFFYLH